VEWGRDLGAHLADTTRSAIATVDAADRAHQSFETLVATQADAFFDRCVLEAETHVDAMNGTLRRPLVRVTVHPTAFHPAAGLLTLRASEQAAETSLVIGKDYGFGDLQPGLYVHERRQGLFRYPFVDGGPAGLLLVIHGRAVNPEDAARLIVEPWLQKLNLVRGELVHRGQAERLALAPLARRPSTPTTDITAMELSATATEADVAAIVAIDAGVFQQAWTPGMFRAVLREGGRLFVAPTPAAIGTGFCVVDRIEAGDLRIVRLAVLPDERRKGVGSALLQHALREGARAGATRAVLDINRSYDACRTFYTRAGFTVTGDPEGDAA